MSSTFFIPPTPSPTDSEGSYFLPLTITDSTSTPVLDLALIYFNSHASNQSHQPIQMSSNSSINMSNVSPAKSPMPLPTQPVESPEPPITPTTITMTLAAHPKLHPDILYTIANSLLTTIAWWETQAAIEVNCLQTQINGLQDHVQHYEANFKKAPEGFIVNDGQVPQFYICYCYLCSGTINSKEWS